MSLLFRLVVAVLIAVAVAIVLPLLGSVLIDMKAEIAVTVGRWIKDNAAVLGILFGALWFFGGGFLKRPGPVA